MLISEMDSAHTYELNDLYIILPEILKSNWSNLRRVKTGFIYKSNVNKNFFDKKYIKKLLQKSKINISRK